MMDVEENTEEIELVAHDTVMESEGKLEEEENEESLKEDQMNEDLVQFIQSDEPLPATKEVPNGDEMELSVINPQAELLQ
eukprot:5860708-Ditylum_brightwellii.AAC.1